jgi:hypothetical protein
LSTEPNAARPATDKPDPVRANERRETEEPSCAKLKREQALPKREKALKDTVDPISA